MLLYRLFRRPCGARPQLERSPPHADPRKLETDDATLNQKLLASEYDVSKATDLVLEAGRMSLHDVFLLHGSEPNRSPRPRRGMTPRFMPTSSVFDREIAREQAPDAGYW